MTPQLPQPKPQVDDRSSEYDSSGSDDDHDKAQPLHVPSAAPCAPPAPQSASPRVPVGPVVPRQTAVAMGHELHRMMLSTGAPTPEEYEKMRGLYMFVHDHIE